MIKLETERLILREYKLDDFDSLYPILSDPETMKYYPAPFSKEKVLRWINWNIENYAKYGFGLFAVTLKETGELIGDCGITIQKINGEPLPEIGYHISKHYQRKGYATEACKACKDFIFENSNYDKIYSYMKYTNLPSYKTALKNGMSFVMEYDDPVNVSTRVYAITRSEWEEELNQQKKA